MFMYTCNKRRPELLLPGQCVSSGDQTTSQIIMDISLQEIQLAPQTVCLFQTMTQARQTISPGIRLFQERRNTGHQVWICYPAIILKINGAC